MTVTAVHFGTTSVPFTVVNATTITANAPAGLTGAQNVRVTTTPGGQSAISAAFTYAAALTVPVITSANTASATEGTVFSYTITATGNPPPTFNATGLPAWLTRAGAVVSGTPPAGSGNSAVTFTVTATNSEGSPSMMVTVNIAEPSAGFNLTYTFPVQVTFSETTGRIPFTNFTGWNPAFAADFHEDLLYDLPTMDDMPIHLYATYVGQPEVRVDFDNWPFSSAPNKVAVWGYNPAHVPPGIFIIGNNATGQPIQLRLVKA